MAGTTNFFTNFPKRDYRFGDNEYAVRFQDLSVYIDILDQVRQYSSFYESYQIQNNERPDHVSYNLYRTEEHYWTFFLLNEHLRLNGWPMDNWRLFRQVKEYYPHIVCMSEGSVFRRQLDRYDSMSTCDHFKEGNLLWFPQSRKAGEILKVNHNLGQIWVDMVDEGRFPIEQIGTLLYSITQDDLIALNNFIALDADPNVIPELQKGNTKKAGYEVSLFPWIPLSAEETVPIPSDWLVTMVEPAFKLKEMYIEDVVENGKTNSQSDSADEQPDSDQSD